MVLNDISVDLPPRLCYKSEYFFHPVTETERVVVRTVPRTAFFLITALLVVCFSAAAEESIYGPPIEFGAGVGMFRMQSRPQWSSKYTGVGMINGSIRLFKGFAVQGGKDIGRGDEPRPDMIDYGVGIKLWTNEKTYQNSYWYGVRYDIPADFVRIDFFGMDFLTFSAGLNTSKFGLYSSYRFTEDKAIKLEKKEKFRVATAEGPYFGIAGRWRFETEDSKLTGSWLGAFGIEAGLRYTRYSDCSLRHSNIEEAKDNYNSYLVYVLGFVKIGLFE